MNHSHIHDFDGLVQDCGIITPATADKNSIVGLPRGQNHGCWWLGDVRNQGTNSIGTDPGIVQVPVDVAGKYSVND